MIFRLSLIYYFLLFLSVESRILTNKPAGWSEPREYSIALNPTRTLLQDDNVKDTQKEWTKKEMTLGYARAVERTETMLEVKSDSTKITEIQAKAEKNLELGNMLARKLKTRTGPKRVKQDKTGAASKSEVMPPVLSRRDNRLHRVKTFKVTISTKNAQPYVSLTIGSKEYQALVDSGSDMTLISRKLFDQLLKERLVVTHKRVAKFIRTADGAAMNIEQAANIPFQISKFPVTFQFLVADGLQMDFLFGYDFMMKTGAVIDFQHNLFTSNEWKMDCPTIREKVSQMLCMTPSSPKTNIVKFVPGKPATVLPVIIGGKNFEALIDSASAVSLITERFVNLLKELRQIERIEKASAKVMIGTAVKELTEQVLIRLKMGRLKLKIPFFIATAVPVDMIIGYDFMSSNQAVLDYKTSSLVYREASRLPKG